MPRTITLPIDRKSVIIPFSTEDEKYDNTSDNSLNSEVAEAVAKEVKQKIKTLGDPRSLTRLSAFKQYSEMTHFFKTDSKYSNTNALDLYKKGWKEHTQLNPVSDWFLLQMRLHATVLIAISAIALALVSLAACAVCLVMLPYLATPLAVLGVGVQYSTFAGSLALCCVLWKKSSSLEKIEEDAKTMPCILN